MIQLPLDLGNMVTQFLIDMNNHMLLQTCKNARVIVRRHPRKSKFIILNNFGDMYGRKSI